MTIVGRWLELRDAEQARLPLEKVFAIVALPALEDIRVEARMLASDSEGDVRSFWSHVTALAAQVATDRVMVALSVPYLPQGTLTGDVAKIADADREVLNEMQHEKTLRTQEA